MLVWKMKEQLESRCCLQAGPTAPERWVHQPRARIAVPAGETLPTTADVQGTFPRTLAQQGHRRGGRLSILYGESGAHPGDPYPWYIFEQPSGLS